MTIFFVSRSKISLRKGRRLHTYKAWGNRTPYTFPYLDIFFFNSSYNSTHVQVWDDAPVPRADALPPTLRPLGDSLYFAPRRIKSYLENVLGFANMSECYSGRYDHTLETQIFPRITVPCSTFDGKVPFVEHTRGSGNNNGTCVEELKLGKDIIQTFVRSSDYATC